MRYCKLILIGIVLSCFQTILISEIISVGSGSYTTSFPGEGEAGRNSFPSGEPQVSGPALKKKILTNDWWSNIIKNNHANNLFNYPMALKTINQGLVVSYIPWGVYDDQEPIIIGISDHNTVEHTMRLVFVDGGFNIGRMTFTFNRELNYNPLFANAGEDIIVLGPATSTTLYGSLSYDNDSDGLNYFWEQIYGPTSVSFSYANNVQTEISDLIQCVYKF